MYKRQTWFKATTTGMFYGQCSELCGKDHAFMPIAVRVVSESDYNKWLDDAKKKYAADNNDNTVHDTVAVAGTAAVQ